MPRRRLLLLAIAPLGLALGATIAKAAENFVCGPGGAPDAKSARCDCPPGKVEKTTGGVSRCIDKPSVKPPPKPSSSTSSPCPPDHVLEQGVCVARCSPDEVWNGAACVTSTPGLTKPKSPQGDAGVSIDGGSADACDGAGCCREGTSWDGVRCIVSSCPQGRAPTPQRTSCCWPGQEGENGECKGSPSSCPTAMRIDDDDCVAACDAPGMVPIGETHGSSPPRCCYPGQTWGVRRGFRQEDGCVGAPVCPPPLLADDDDCLTGEALAARMERRRLSVLVGVGALGIDLFYLQVAAKDAEKKDSSWYGAGLRIWGHFPDLPTRINLDFFFASARFDSHCEGAASDPSGPTCTDGSRTGVGLFGMLLGVAFAPLSLPTAETNEVSLLNPWLGVQTGFAGTLKSSNGSTNSSTPACASNDRACPSSSGFLGVDLGNTVYLGPVALTIDYVPWFVGGSTAPRKMLTVSIGVAARRF